MHITEIFKSIQGEGTRAGLPCVFVRFTGCNLRCTWCDTAYAFHGGQKMTVNEVLARVDVLSGRASSGKAAVPLVELTGGEPLLQEEIYPLADGLLAAGYEVLIETSGERFVGRLPKDVIKIVDVKCPDSGEADTFDSRNLAELHPKDEVKFVISSRRDYEFARDFTHAHRLTEGVNQVVFSPVNEDPQGKWQGLPPRQLVEWILADGLAVRLGLQLHKIVWDSAMRSV
jgi:7-carboxy-7-deazaguanine synthase